MSNSTCLQKQISNKRHISLRIPQNLANQIEQFAVNNNMKKTEAYQYFLQEGLDATNYNSISDSLNHKLDKILLSVNNIASTSLCAAPSPTFLPSRTIVILAVRYVCQMYDAIEKAILFGSYARGDQRPGSDCDVRLILDRSAQFNLRDVSDFTKRVTQILGIECNLITADVIANKQVAQSIEAEGELIYER